MLDSLPKADTIMKQAKVFLFIKGKSCLERERNLEAPNVWTTKATKLAEPGDILISVRAPVGAINITNQKICIGRGLTAIKM